MTLNASPSFSGDDTTAIPSWVCGLQNENSEVIRETFYGSGEYPFTSIDLFSTDEISIASIQHLIFNVLGVKESKNTKGIQKLQNIYDNSISYMERVLFRKIPRGLKNKRWENINEFSQTIQAHTQRIHSGAYSLMFCAILKVMLIESELDNNPLIADLDHDMQLLLDKVQNIPGLQKKKKKKGDGYTEYEEYELDGIHQGSYESRPKNIDSIRTKMIYNRPYDALGKFKDLLAMRFELDTKQGEAGYMHTILKLRDSLYGKGKEVQFEIKGNILSKDSIAVLEKNKITVTIKPSKGGTSLDYTDAKFVGGHVRVQDGKKKRSLNPEIQFVLPNNRNEAGFSKHEVYDLKKIISANVRLFGALTIGNLGYLLSQYKSIFDPRSLLNHLLYPQDGSAHPFLLLVTEKSQRTHKKKQYITTSDVYDEKVGGAIGKSKKTINISSLYPNYPTPINYTGVPSSGEVLNTVHRAIESILRNSSSPSIL